MRNIIEESKKHKNQCNEGYTITVEIALDRYFPLNVIPFSFILYPVYAI